MGSSAFLHEPQIEADSTEDSTAFAENRYSKFLFQRESILRNAPECSGVYGLFSAFWIYVGEADNLRARILKHLEGDDPCIVHYRPSGFAFELASANDRRNRREYLMKELQPLCNGAASHSRELACIAVRPVGATFEHRSTEGGRNEK
jgi:hypothetical protein